MHRIDVPSATVDHLFTEGSPTAGVPATQVSASWMNDVQEEIVSVLTASGITPVKGVQNQLLQAIRSISASVVGAARNVNAYVTTAAAATYFGYDEVIVKGSAGSQSYRLGAGSKLLNLATVGAGGMDTGAPPVSGFVAVYVIYNPSNGNSAVLAANATPSLVAEAYNASNMPAGYTASALISVWPTDASGQLKVGHQKDRSLWFPAIAVLSATALAPTYASVNISGAVPKNAKTVSGYVGLNCSGGSGGMTMALAGDAAGSGRIQIGGYVTANIGPWGAFSDMLLPVQQQLSHFETSSGAPTGYGIALNISGYTI